MQMNSTRQTGRLLSVDLARGLAVFFMIAVHVLTVFGNQEVQESIFGQIIQFFGGPPAAPVFMTLMGLSFMYSRKAGLKPKLLRGLMIFLSGYLLNLLRFVIPFEVGKWQMPELIASTPLHELSTSTLFVTVDILQFAGIALMIMALIQELKINKWLILSLAFVIILISPLLWGISTGIPAVDFVLDLLWGDRKVVLFDNVVAFPLFPWLAFPLLGMVLGETIKSSSNQKKSFNTIGWSGAIVLLVGIAIVATNPDYQFNDYYHSRQGAMILMCGFVMVWLFLAKLLTDHIPPNPIFELIYKWSRGVTNIYFIHWVIAGWSIGIFGIQDCSYLTVIVLIVCITFVSQMINMLYGKMKKRRTVK
jgi:exosortase/archaeosortase family protein